MGDFYLWVLKKIRIVHVRLFDTLEYVLVWVGHRDDARKTVFYDEVY